MADEQALWYVVTVENNGMGDLIQEVTVPIE